MSGSARRSLPVRNGDPDDLTAGLGELGNLLEGGLRITGVGGRHRLHDDRVVAADLDIADLQGLGSCDVALATWIYTSCANAVLRQERVPAENTIDVPERDDEHQQEQTRQGRRSGPALPSRERSCARHAISSIRTKNRRPPSSAGSGSRFRIREVEREDDAELGEDVPGRERALLDDLAGDLTHAYRAGNLAQGIAIGQDQLTCCDHQPRGLERLGESPRDDLASTESSRTSEALQRSAVRPP